MLTEAKSSQSIALRNLGLFLSVPFVLLIFSLSFFTTRDISEKTMMAVWGLGTGAFAIFIFIRTANNVALNRTLTLVAGYLVFAYPFKAVLSQSDLGRDQTPEFFVPGLLFSKSLIPAVAYTSGAVVALLLVYFAVSQLSMAKFDRGYRPRFSRLYLVIFLSLLVKFVAQHYLIWGVPNQPTQNAIPLVTGAVVMYIKLGIFHLIALAVTSVFMYPARMEEKLTLGVLAAGYLALDFSVGSKYSLVYLVVTALFSVALMKSRISLFQTRILALVGLCLVVLSLYPVVHNYRFARKSSPKSDVATLIQRSIRMTAERAENNVVIDSVLQVAKRINGFQNHAAAVLYADTIQAGWRELISSSEASQNYTTAVTGIDHESNTYGITQCGMISILFRGSPLMIFVGGLLLNLMVTGLAVVCVYGATRIRANWYAAGISNGLFLVFVQFQGGNLGFSAKQYVTILFTIWFSKYFFVPTRSVMVPVEPRQVPVGDKISTAPGGAA